MNRCFRLWCTALAALRAGSASRWEWYGSAANGEVEPELTPLAALEAQRRVAESFSVGSVDRRRAMAQVIQLESAHSGPDDLRTMLDDFRRDFPSAPELDDLAATISGVLQVRGDALGASAVLDGVQGPKSSLERGYLLLAKGDLDGGRSALLLALTGLPAAEATPVIQLAGLLGRLSPPAASVLARSGVKAHHGQYLAAARDLSSAAADLDLEEAPTVLAEAARIALEGGEYELVALGLSVRRYNIMLIISIMIIMHKINTKFYESTKILASIFYV